MGACCVSAMSIRISWATVEFLGYNLKSCYCASSIRAILRLWCYAAGVGAAFPLYLPYALLTFSRILPVRPQQRRQLIIKDDTKSRPMRS